ncbi:hypothetical protein BX661DRAFT_169765 [Kickxella alabastrina]|uniref:uncharacterized protein n=1 Tax=Kickxella alabastrina TaxID=61397 RepID=UPI00221F136D|nr:uncharacterized protein BX661DRAFT_169765 [Kickxella alabastrina]KAI7831908.1 hypothetical protein BX661DRAFT_169765 [Kickxella alabastrina]
MSASVLPVATGPLPAATALAQLMPSVYSGFAKLAEQSPVLMANGGIYTQHMGKECGEEICTVRCDPPDTSLDASGPATFDDLRSHLEITLETISSSFHSLQNLNQL